MPHLYVLRCSDGTLYTGITTDVDRRVHEHNTSSRGAKYTRARRPVEVVYVRNYRSLSAAARAEAKMKALSRAEKLALIERVHRRRATNRENS